MRWRATIPICCACWLVACTHTSAPGPNPETQPDAVGASQQASAVSATEARYGGAVEPTGATPESNPPPAADAAREVPQDILLPALGRETAPMGGGAGDHLTAGEAVRFSRHRLGRPVRGVKAELGGIRSTDDSFSVLMGTGTGAGDNVEEMDYSMGVSWDHRLGASTNVGLNTLYSRRSPADWGTDEAHWTVGLGGETHLPWWGDGLELTGELALLRGDTAASRDVAATGGFVDLEGQAGDRWDYGVRLERYGRGFRPLGTTMVADQQSADLRLGFRGPADLKVTGRRLFRERGLSNRQSTPLHITSIAMNAPITMPVYHAKDGELNAQWRERCEPRWSSTKAAIDLSLAPTAGRSGWGYATGMVREETSGQDVDASLLQQFVVAAYRTFRWGGMISTMRPMLSWHERRGSRIEAAHLGAGIALTLEDHVQRLEIAVGHGRDHADPAMLPLELHPIQDLTLTWEVALY